MRSWYELKESKMLVIRFPRFIKTGKDKIKKDELSNVVYQINCKDCDYSYVGQTKRKLKTRLKEHINDLKK